MCCEYMREKCQANIKAVLIMYGNGKFPLFHNNYLVLQYSDMILQYKMIQFNFDHLPCDKIIDNANKIAENKSTHMSYENHLFERRLDCNL